MGERHVNLTLGWLGAAAFLSGWLAFSAGTGWGAWVVAFHGVAGLGLLVLAPAKLGIARRGLRRPRPGRITSMTFAALAVVVIASGILLTVRRFDRIGPLTTMQFHVGSAVAAILLGVAHLRRRPVPAVDHQRRRSLRTIAVALGGGALWIGWEGGLRATGMPGSGRRFTGSHPRGSHHPPAMPVTQWLDDRVLAVDPGAWRLRLPGSEQDLESLLSLPHEEVTAVIDCTGGWYAEQRWAAVPLRLLVAPDATTRSIEVRSVTGYSRRFPMRDLDRLWLATGYEGSPLSAGHGAPARLVAPGRRGFWWVKWVVSIRPSSLPWWVQAPFPLT